MLKLEPIKLIKEYENLFIFSSLSIIFFAFFITFMLSYFKYLDINLFPLFAVISVFLSFTFFYKSFELKKEVDKTKEIEFIRKIMKDLSKK